LALTVIVEGNGAEGLCSELSDAPLTRGQVLVQAGKYGRVQDVGSSHVTFEEDAQELEDEDQDFGLLLENELLDEHAQDVGINDGLDAEGELRQINEAGVGVVSDLFNLVVEKGSGYFDQLVLNKNHAPHL